MKKNPGRKERRRQERKLRKEQKEETRRQESKKAPVEAPAVKGEEKDDKNVHQLANEAQENS